MAREENGTTVIHEFANNFLDDRSGDRIDGFERLVEHQKPGVDAATLQLALSFCACPWNSR